MDPAKDETSAISERPLSLKRLILDALFGIKTLSSLALPILELGSSCSRSMLKRADRLGIRRLVRKSSVDGKAVARLISFLGSG